MKQVRAVRKNHRKKKILREERDENEKKQAATVTGFCFTSTLHSKSRKTYLSLSKIITKPWDLSKKEDTLQFIIQLPFLNEAGSRSQEKSEKKEDFEGSQQISGNFFQKNVVFIPSFNRKSLFKRECICFINGQSCTFMVS